MSNEKDLYKLTSVDERGSRLDIVPAEVRGKFRRWRTQVHLILLAVFLLLPWLKVAGHQAVLLNIPRREFNLFGVLFRAHDAPLIFLVFIILAMGLAFVTAVWGRIWCGWACPQTVFIDTVFRRIELWVEGGYLERRKLRKAPMSFRKFRKVGLKWFLFAVVSSLIAHSFIAYFSGSDELLKMMTKAPQENREYFLIVTLVTLAVLFDFAWFREQFCVIMCPYGRIQSVLLESNSLAVVYDAVRGEPRRGISSTKESLGDCVSCNRCVEVCPTGIDIRNGLQMECIACTACVDACDAIMAKTRKPPGLISYKTLNDKPMRFFKLKTAFYGLVIAIAAIFLVYSFSSREPLNIALLRAKDSPYIIFQNELGEGMIRNHFRLHLTNQTHLTSFYRVEFSEESRARGFVLTMGQNPVVLKGKSSETVHLFVHLPTARLAASGRLPIEVVLLHEDGRKFERELTFLGPTR